MQKEAFRKKINEKETDIYKISGAAGAEAWITNYGGIIVKLLVPDKNGKLVDVIQGYDTLDGYINGNPYFSALIGRFSNRIEHGKFELNGESYQLSLNIDGHHLHGGIEATCFQVWDVVEHEENSLKLYLFCKDGSDGYPGNLKTWVEYTMTDENELKIEVKAETDKETIISYTSHPFFNLNGDDSDNIFDHLYQINADHYLPVKESLVNNGDVEQVDGSVFDLRTLRKIDLSDLSIDPQIELANGYDHNYVLKKENSLKIIHAAQVIAPSGIQMDVFTNQPGLQFYTGNWLDGIDQGKNNMCYQKRSSFCLEAQQYPNSINRPHFPQSILKPGEQYYFFTSYKFSINKS